MTQPRNTDPYSDARAFYGSELRRLREEAGLTQDQLGERAFCSGSYVAHFESGMRRPQLELSTTFDEVLGSGMHLQRLCRLARNAKVADYFADAAELERQARTISECSPMFVPGLLQTEAYARTLTRASRRFACQQEVEQLVSARLERAQLLDGPTAPVDWTIIHESALRVTVGAAAIMREQLAYLVETVQSRPNVVLQVLPFAAGPHPFMNTMVSLMEFSDAPPVVYTESAYSGQLIEDPALVAQFQSSYDLARATALSPEASLSLIESAAKEWATHEHHN
ncbi:Scr1 family TA system antitoxin-like transcriptional regulator [Streptomyces sp. NPDC053048]|uniref:helix-turn-helix domain-containing protein n=1 Tax=Streptomyces sp. NPDC053048 TaxID=3365694 RepID=UPI0037D3BB18